jgi:integrase
MAAIFKRNKKDRNEPYTIQYQDHLGKRCTVKGFTDKELTEQLAARLEGEARMRQTGLIDPKLEQFNQNKLLPLEEHVAVFAKNLADNFDNYADLILSWVRRTIRDGKFETFVDFTLDRVQACPWDLRKKEDWSNRTYNHYVQALHTFCNWCVTTKRLIANSILGLTRLNIEVDIRHKRRALEPEEMVQLIGSAPGSKVRVEGYRGELRARLYTVAFFTGLRRAELASLTPRSFKLAGEHPT